MKITRNPEETKKRILEEAEIQFSELGFLAASVNVIAENAKINKRMIYHYFESKEGLYKEVLASNIRKLITRGMNIVDKSTDSKECVAIMIGAYFDFLKNNPNYVRLMLWNDLSNNMNFKEEIYENLMDFFKELKEIYERGVLKKEFKPGLDLVQVIISISGLCFMTFARKNLFDCFMDGELEENLESRKKHIIDLILNTLIRKDEN